MRQSTSSSSRSGSSVRRRAGDFSATGNCATLDLLIDRSLLCQDREPLDRDCARSGGALAAPTKGYESRPPVALTGHTYGGFG